MLLAANIYILYFRYHQEQFTDNASESKCSNNAEKERQKTMICMRYTALIKFQSNESNGNICTKTACVKYLPVL